MLRVGELRALTVEQVRVVLGKIGPAYFSAALSDEHQKPMYLSDDEPSYLVLDVYGKRVAMIDSYYAKRLSAEMVRTT
jgi:hypothetical protein